MSGSLTGLRPEEREATLGFYERIAAVASKHGVDLYLPHQHSDPVQDKDLPPAAVDRMDRMRVAEAHLLIAEVSQPSAGVGIELEMSRAYGTNVILVAEEKALNKRRRDRVDVKILGIPQIRTIISYESQDDALLQLEKVFVEKGEELKMKGPLCQCQRDRKFFSKTS